jgi:hypothetical protein
MNANHVALSARTRPLLLAAAILLAGCDAHAAPEAQKVGPGHLPDRLLRCTLGRATNLDPHKDQTTDEIIYDGRHALTLFLPSVPMRTAPPPDATEPAEPVDPRTAIVADPDHIAGAAALHFDRVVDYWPDRVELTAPVAPGVSKLIIVTKLADDGSRVSVFMTDASDAATFDMARIYQGPCEVVTGSGATPGR